MRKKIKVKKRTSKSKIRKEGKTPATPPDEIPNLLKNRPIKIIFFT